MNPKNAEESDSMEIDSNDPVVEPVEPSGSSEEKDDCTESQPMESAQWKAPTAEEIR